jgi:hypothetical protein
MLFSKRPISHSAVLQIGVSYRPEFSKTRNEQVFDYFTIEDSEGRYQWFPVSGKGRMWSHDEVPVLATPTVPFNLIEAVPFLAVEAISVEQTDPQTNNGHSLKILHSIRNVGGVAATGLLMDWIAWDKATGLGHCWSNRFQVALNKKYFLPHSPAERIWTDFSDNAKPSVYEGIIAGRLILVGEIHYKDPLNHDFGATFSAVRTNGEFQVMYPVLLGYFKNAGLQIPN